MIASVRRTEMNEPAARTAVILRRYPARTFENALDVYEADLAGMTSEGWIPVAQVWGWDPVGSAGWFVGGSHWKPGDGTLAVTYRRESPDSAGIHP
jgi:hypothetical protein